jgi:hypothetical protein
VTGPDNQARWARLFRMACGLIRQVNSEALVIDHWSLGGATALMLQISHRESYDIDIFLRDPQLLPFLDPEKRDFEFVVPPAKHYGDGSRFLKLAFNELGEIDFIVAETLTAEPTVEREIEGERSRLEMVPEIVTKKVVYRGSSIKPRDLFDIAASAERHFDQIVTALRPYSTEVARTMSTIEKLNPEFVSHTIAQLKIHENFALIARTAIVRTKELLQAV